MGGQVPAHASSVTLFSSCEAIKKHLAQAPDGDYLLFNNGNLLTVYCAGMSTMMPKEYLDLNMTGAGANFSQYTAGGASPGTNVRTTFTKLRIDPSTLKVDIGDLTFASSAGSLRLGGTTVTSMPYAVAMSCIAPANPAGVGNVNLTGTPFQVSSTFEVGGYIPEGAATFSSGNQVVGLTGGGYCGWITTAPTLFNPVNPSPGMYDLSLSCGATPVVNSHVCVSIGSLASVAEKTVQRKGSPAVSVRYKGHALGVVGTDGKVLS